MAPLPQEQRYTFADLLAWDDNTRYELYDGVPPPMALIPLSMLVFWTIAPLI